MRVDQGQRRTDGRLGKARLAHREPQQPPDPHTRRPGPDEQDPGIRQRSPGGPERGHDPGDHDRRRALDVVVERRHAVLVAVEDAQGVLLFEVLELDEAAGPDLLDTGHERFDDRVVRRATQPRRAIPEVQRVGEQRRVVGAHVEGHREGHRWVDAARRRVQRELADRDRHPARALVAEAEDPLVVGDDDEPHVLERALAQDLRHALDVRRRDPRPAGPPDDVAELLARAADRRRVDDREELLEVLGEEPVEQRRVAVLERGEPDVALQVVGLDPEMLELEVDLLVDREDAVGEEAAQPERLALGGREREVLREQSIPEERRSCERDLGRATGRDVVERGGQGTHDASIVRPWTHCPGVSAGPTACAPPRCSPSTSTPRR